MKRLKKFAGLLLAVTMILAYSVTAFAAGNGSITITNAVPGQVYTIYRILDLESYDSTTNAYAYKANSDWLNWLETQTQYVEITDDGQNYVTWKDGANAAEFAKAALAYAEEAGIQPVNTATAGAAAEGENRTTVEFTGLDLGYYLVDTSLGTLCSLDTTDDDAEITEKNDVPSTEKEVQEDSDGSWGPENTAQIGDTVNFRTTITAQPGAENYVLHDEMSAGLTLDVESIKVTLDGTELTEGDDYTISTTGLTDGCDFEITFDQDYLNSIESETDNDVTYSAVLNEDAEIYDNPNENKTYLDYGDDNHTTSTPPSTTETFSFSFDIVKTDNDFKLLDGAEFELYDAQTGGNKIALVDEGNGAYRVATDDEEEAEGFKSAVIVAKDGQATVNGLDADTTYYLEETKAPDGYNKLAERVEVAIVDTNLSTTIDSDIWEKGDGGVQITNISGALLPSTGGMGTTLFYVGGGILMAGAAVLLIIRKSRSREE